MKMLQVDTGSLPVELNNGDMPIRIAVVDEAGFPHIASLWYQFDNGCFYCATHQSAWILPRLRNNPMVGFEIAVNQPPYRGVRGTGRAATGKLDNDLLERLIATYLGNVNIDFSRWLLSRKDQEYVIEITPETLTCWDYRERMRQVQSPGY